MANRTRRLPPAWAGICYSQEGGMEGWSRAGGEEPKRASLVEKSPVTVKERNRLAASSSVVPAHLLGPLGSQLAGLMGRPAMTKPGPLPSPLAKELPRSQPSSWQGLCPLCPVSPCLLAHQHHFPFDPPRHTHPWLVLQKPGVELEAEKGTRAPVSSAPVPTKPVPQGLVRCVPCVAQLSPAPRLNWKPG